MLFLKRYPFLPINFIASWKTSGKHQKALRGGGKVLLTAFREIFHVFEVHALRKEGDVYVR